MSDDCGSLPFAETRMCRHRSHTDAAVPSREEPQTACARLGLRMLLVKLVLALGAVGALFALLPLKAPEAPAQSLPEQKTEDGLATNEVPGLKADFEADRSQADRIEPGLEEPGGSDPKEEISSLPPDVSTVHETSIEPAAPSTKQKQKPQKLKTQQTSKPKENSDKGSKPKTDMDKASKPKVDVVDKAVKPTLSEEIHVCFCSDDTDWRPLAAAINSTLQNAKRPHMVTFHLITSQDLAPVVSSVLVKVLPALATQLKVHSSTTLHSRIKSLISYRKSSGARKGLASPFNFAPFYLEDFISQSGELPQRLIYLDTDVLLLDDIGALWKTDMKGMPAAAVEDCSQSFELYIDFAEMEELGLKSGSLSPKECVFNRGIFVMDVTQWKHLHITQDIEHWMSKYRESKKDIYKFGMSQPPWLLALHKKYHKLGSEWNCRGLGRDTLSLKELKELKHTLSLDFKALQKVGARAMGEQATPYIASCSREAMLLHFNGKLKPWRSRRWVRKQPSPMCLVKATTFPTLQRKNVNGMDFVRCADIWSNFLSPESVEVLNATAVQFYESFKQ